MLDHFFVSRCDGALHDTRVKDWHMKPLRENYSRHHTEIKTVADYKATLRAGRFAWPGGYPLYMICHDGESLCFACARKEARNIMPAIYDKDRSGWQVVACDVNYEGNEMFCAHCNAQIESAYGED
jgi:hypothetical protein